MLLTSDPSLDESVRVLNNHGRPTHSATAFVPEVVGYKYRMSNIQAALGLGQLERLDELIARKVQILEEYKERLTGLGSTRLNTCGNRDRLGGWMPTIEWVDPIETPASQLRETLVGAGIDARPVFPSLSNLPLFNESPSRCPVASRFATRALNLPSYHDLSSSDMDRVCAVLTRALVG